VSHSYQTWFTWLSGNWCLCMWVAWPCDHKVCINTVQPCDTNQVRSDSDFGVKVYTIQFYAIEHNFKSNRWIELKLYQKIPEVFVYLGVHFQENPCSKRTCNIGPNRLYEFCYLLPFDLWGSINRLLIWYLIGCIGVPNKSS
jgi:hypothetical protein